MKKKSGGKKKAKVENHEVITISGGPLDGQKMRMMNPCPDEIVLGLGSEVYVRNGGTSEFLYAGSRIRPEVIHTDHCDDPATCNCAFTTWLRVQDMRR